MLDFRIDTFLEVCRLMNYTRAAEQLNLTQPAVSQHIRWLEEQCGVKLFHYENKQLNLTAAGRCCARRYHHEAGSDVFVQKDAGSRQRGR